MECLLCLNKEVKIEQTFNSQHLIKCYRAFLDVSRLLSEPKINLYHCPNCSLRFFDPKLAGDDLFYSELGKYDWYYNHPGKTEYDYVLKYVSEGLNILDIGSGRGVLFSKIKQKVNYTGLELSTKAVELAQQDGINVIQRDLVEFADENKDNFDLVCSFQVLEHLTELQTFIQATYEVMKKGAKLVIAVPNNKGFISYSANYTLNLPPHHTILWDKDSLTFLAKKFKFKVAEVHLEKLQDVHRDYAYTSFLVRILKFFTFTEQKIVDESPRHYKFWRIATRFLESRYTGPVLRILLKPIVKYGQSIIITLEK